jgi:hypothetical protein
MLQLPSFALAPLTISHRILSVLTVREVPVTTLMEAQIYEPIENAASPRPVYPDHPSAALTASIEARREQLVIPTPRAAAPRLLVKSTGTRIGLFAAEVKR